MFLLLLFHVESIWHLLVYLSGGGLLSFHANFYSGGGCPGGGLCPTIIFQGASWRSYFWFNILILAFREVAILAFREVFFVAFREVVNKTLKHWKYWLGLQLKNESSRKWRFNLAGFHLKHYETNDLFCASVSCAAPDLKVHFLEKCVILSCPWQKSVARLWNWDFVLR